MVFGGTGILGDDGQARNAYWAKLKAAGKLPVVEPDWLEEALAVAARTRSEEQAAAQRHQAVREIEESLLVAIPAIAELATDDLNESAQRRRETQKSYSKAFGRFRNWALERDFTEMPFAPAVVAFYFVDRAADGISHATLCFDRAAIGYFHLEQNFANPCDDSLVKATMAYIKKLGGPDDGSEMPVAAAA